MSSTTKMSEDCNGGTELFPLDGRNNSLQTKMLRNNNKFSHEELTENGGPNVRVQRHKPWSRRRTKFELYLIALCVLLFLACVSFVVIAFTRESQLNRRPPSDVCLTDHCVRTALVRSRKSITAQGPRRAAQLMDGMDRTVDPCEDFFQYACGTWNKKHVVPEDKSSFNTFEKLHDDLQVTLKALLEEPKNKFDSNATYKAKVLYASCVNMSQIERIGDQPLKDVLNSVGGWPVVKGDWDESQFDLEHVLTTLRREYNAPMLIESIVAADDKNSSVHILQMDQAGLALPSRDYYLDTTRSMFVNAYVKYMTNVAVLLGADKSRADREFAEMLKFETDLANITMTQTEKQDTGALYTKLTLRELQKKIPEINWLRYLQGLVDVEIDENEKVVLFALKYLKKLGKLVTKTPKRTLANYLLWRLTMGFAPELTDEYQQVKNQYKKVLQGVSRDKVRWQKCVEFVNGRMGMAVGGMFIRDHFKKESKTTALAMISDIREAFNELLFENDWMDDETKAVAKEKADAMNERIGYADFITDPVELDKTYQKLSFHNDDYFRNILQIEEYDANRTFVKLRKRVDKERWEQDPAVVNAFYNPNANDIVFPAGILQPLFYSQYFPKSLNYGGIGVVIGHEITHGFDDKGRQYDKDGNLRQWWNNQTIEAFRKRTQCIVDQYSQFTIEPFGLKIDGQITQGENIADNGGLKESFRAYKKWVELHGEEPLLPGITLSHDQLFFLNYAQIWCGNMRGQEALHKIRTAVHSPGPIRVIGPLSNSEDFAKAYNCPKGSRMNPINKCSVW